MEQIIGVCLAPVSGKKGAAVMYFTSLAVASVSAIRIIIWSMLEAARLCSNVGGFLAFQLYKMVRLNF